MVDDLWKPTYFPSKEQDKLRRRTGYLSTDPLSRCMLPYRSKNTCVYVRHISSYIYVSSRQGPDLLTVIPTSCLYDVYLGVHPQHDKQNHHGHDSGAGYKCEVCPCRGIYKVRSNSRRWVQSRNLCKVHVRGIKGQVHARSILL